MTATEWNNAGWWRRTKARAAVGRAHMSGFTKAFGSVHDLPEPFASVYERGGPEIAPYARLAKRWHEHAASFSPDYGPYIEVLAGQSHSPGSAAADIACGTGLSIEPLAARYAQVFGLDLSHDMLQVARARLGGHSRVSLLQGDLTAFTLPQSVNLITCVGDSLNYVRQPEQLADTFRCARKALNERGVFMFDVLTERAMLGLSERAFFLCETKPGPQSHRPSCEHSDVDVEFQCWQCFRYDSATQLDDACVVFPEGIEFHRRRFISPDEIRRTAADTGFDVLDVFGSGMLGLTQSAGLRQFWVLMRRE